MLSKYTELFKELYERKFYDNRSPKNSLEKVQLLQRKMHESINKNQHKKQNSFTNSALCLKDVNEDQSKNFIREIMKGNRKPSTHQGIRKSLWVNTNQQSFLPLREKRMSQTAGRSYRSQTQRINPSKNNSQQHSMIKLKHFFEKEKKTVKEKQRGKTSSERRVKTPSKNVVIGGKNLEMQAEEYRKQFRKIDKEIQKYQRQITSRDGSSPKPLTHRRKVIRYEKQMPMEKKIKKKIQKEKKQQKEENIDLRPWAVFPLDHQYY